MAFRPPRAQQPQLSGIYGIVNESPRAIELTRAMLAGGIRIVQYRAKTGIDSQHAHAIRELTRSYDALFLLNDAWREVETYRADGAHIGPDDARPREFDAIRSALGERILGVSCGTEEEARFARARGADYIGVGAVYATVSKDDAGAPIGIAGLRRIVTAAAGLPVAAIGGITLESIAEVRSAGAAMVAVISAISAADDPQQASAQLVRAWNAGA
jgi:thiamine-phosphate pyrophosphorylase